MQSDTPMGCCANPTEQESFSSGLFQLLELDTHLHFWVYNKHFAVQESDDLIYDSNVFAWQLHMLSRLLLRLWRLINTNISP